MKWELRADQAFGRPAAHAARVHAMLLMNATLKSYSKITDQQCIENRSLWILT
jgi:hypothetical protein